MLEFGGVVALGVDVADLLELERAFERGGIEAAAADVEKIVGMRRGLGDLFDARCLLQDLAKEIRNCFNLADEVFAPLVVESSTVTWQVNALVDATLISGPACR